MCKPASFVVMKGGIFFSCAGDSHEEIICEHELVETGARGVQLVRVEIVPPDSRYDLPIEQWVYRVDQDMLPEWYDADECERRVRSALPAWYSSHVITTEGTCSDGQTRIALGTAQVTQTDGTLYAYDHSQVTQSDGTLYAYDHSQVTQSGGKCYASDNSQITQSGGECNAYDNAQITMSGGKL